MEEETEYLAYLVPAFGLIWAAVFGYIFWLSRKQRQLEQDIASLKEEMEEDERG